MAKRFSDPDAELALKVKETGDNEAMKKILDSHSGVYLMKIESNEKVLFQKIVTYTGGISLLVSSHRKIALKTIIDFN